MTLSDPISKILYEKATIFKIINIKDDKVFIDYTITSINSVMDYHKECIENDLYSHECRYLHQHMRKIGIEYFYAVIIDEVVFPYVIDVIDVYIIDTSFVIELVDNEIMKYNASDILNII